MTRSMMPLFAAVAAILADRASGTLPAPPVRAEVVSVEGFVQRQSAGFGSRQRLTSVPLPLAQGQSLSCGRPGKATIRFEDLSRIDLGPDSLFLLQEGRPDRTAAILNAGRIEASVTRIPGRTFEISTPAAVVRVVGTGFAVQVKNPEETLVEVVAGEVVVQGRWQGRLVGDAVRLRAGQEADVIRGVVGLPTEISRPPLGAGAPAPELPDSGKLLDPDLERRLNQEADGMFGPSPGADLRNP